MRQRRGWTLRDLAQRVSTRRQAVHFTTVAKLERSQRPLTAEWALRFAQVFGIEPRKIYTDPTCAAAETATLAQAIGSIKAQAEGITIEAGATPEPREIAQAWLDAFRACGGGVTIGPAGQLVPWTHYSDRCALIGSSTLMESLFDRPGLALALRTLIAKVQS